MKKALVLTLALLFVLGMSASAQITLTNGNFEDPTNHALGWNLGTGVSTLDYPDAWMAPGLCPAEGAGRWGITAVNNYGISDHQATQRINTVGLYTINASGWFRLFSGVGEGVSSARLALLIDNVEVATSETLLGVNGGWGEWTQLTLPTWTGNVGANIRLRPIMHLDGSGDWAQAVADSFQMTANVVPEPASIVALMSGLVGIGGLVIRRKK